ncbi:DNA ligase D [Oricola cellulosilytica]|uniref:DNA ligase (ATP) n=1 Tax=Oricola cellulosilytica TaxID=1429082 RepID=A0A4R0PGM0_9HYPH|nr:DNA ligase D [Oricola cellulosilytica]
MRAEGKLAEYRRKRDFDKTSEPAGSRRSGSSRRRTFVVQKHAASRLHYDFRLEWSGVLLSWAVTRGPSTDPSAKRLAVRTEDHPLDYATFEGTIPKKQYGGGTVMLWDRGWWEPSENITEGLKAGKLKFVLHGERMIGAWTLVRMRGREKRENWLLIKERDRFAEDGEDILIERFTTSIESGRTMEEIAEGRAARKTGSRQTGKQLSLPTPAFVKPQLATLMDTVPEGDDWLHETKFDGYRCLAALGKDGVRLYTRTGLDWTDRYAGLPEAFTGLPCKNALIDGEVISRSNGGGSAFSALQRDLEEGRPVAFAAFDLLELDGRSLKREPLVERKRRLEKLLERQPPARAIRFSQHVLGNGVAVFNAISEAGGEGIISKAAGSTYRSGRNRNWLKIKVKRRQEFVVGGYTPSSRRGRPFASLLIGSYEDGDLVYRGRVGSGFSERDLDRISGLMKDRSAKSSPFAAVPREVARTARWVRPELVVEVEYAELTGEGAVRHGVHQGVRVDKEMQMVKLEVPEDDKEGRSEVLGIRISNADRVIFPDAGCTKLDLAQYYAKASERLLDYAGDRPLSLLRCPAGRDGECFFQKHAGKGFPKEIESIDIEESSGKTEPYMVVRRQSGFVAAAQMGTIEFHIWGSRTDVLEKPDRLVFDLDPDEGLSFSSVKKAAIQLREFLDDLGLASAPMVTGGKGVHVIVPLRRTAGWETVTTFARTIAAHFADMDPEHYVATMSKAKRKGKIFIDWLRNDRGSTAIAPYSVRARKGAPVAVPVSWEELSRLKAANTFDMKKAVKRLESACPLAGVEAQTIGKAAIDALEKRIAGRN